MLPVRAWKWLPVLFLCATSARAQDGQQEALNLIRAGHIMAIESIRTLRCQIQIEDGVTESALHLGVSGQYARVGSIVKIHEVYPNGLVQDIHMDPTSILALGKMGGANVRTATSAVRLPANEITGRCDVWEAMLLNFPGRETARVDISGFLDMPHEAISARRTRDDGKETFYLDLVYDDPDLGKNRLQCWFAPEANYLVRHMVRTLGSSRSEFRIEEFTEAKPGVFIPTRCLVKATKDGRPAGAMRTTLTNIAVNEPIARASLDLRVPGGVNLTDRITGYSYVVDDNGQPSGARRKIAPSVLPAFDQSPGGVFGHQTDTEAPSWYRYVFCGAAFLLIVGLVGVIKNRLRQRNAEA